MYVLVCINRSPLVLDHSLRNFFFTLPTWTTVALPVFSTVCHLKQRTQFLKFSKKIPVCMTLRTVDIRIVREKTASCPKRRRSWRRVEYLPSLRDVSGFASSMFHKCFKQVKSRILRPGSKLTACETVFRKHARNMFQIQCDRSLNKEIGRPS